MRLNRYLASCGVASRRKSDELIEQGKVFVNKEPAESGMIVNPKKDIVEVEGKRVYPQQKGYYIFYKPLNVLTTLSDPQGRKTISEFISHLSERLFPVGRLDFDSEGLLFLTNDGQLAHKVQHPKYEIEKEYLVKVSRRLNEEEELRFREGVSLEEGVTSKSELKYLNSKGLYQVILHQGWHRQIRRMFESFGVEVIALKRVRIGNLKLEDLKPGKYRKLKEEEIKTLKRILF